MPPRSVLFALLPGAALRIPVRLANGGVCIHLTIGLTRESGR